MKKILDVKVLDSHKLLLTYELNELRVFDVTIMFKKGIFAELKDPSIFNTVKIAFNTIEWDNGADIDPEDLYLFSTAYKDNKKSS